MQKRPYRRMAVKSVIVAKIAAGRDGQSLAAGIDISKEWTDTILRWENGDFSWPWRAQNPSEIRLLVERLAALASGRRMVAAMESSGTYGEPLRQALTAAGIAVMRVSGKAVHDYAEILDGVPSNHDAKDAALIAELAAIGKCWPWPYAPPSEADERLGLCLEEMDAHQRQKTMWTNRLEAALAVVWPETASYLAPSSAVLLQAIMKYGGPAGLAARGEPAVAELYRWGGNLLSREKARALALSAARTIGIRQSRFSEERLRLMAREALRERAAVLHWQKQLRLGVGDNPVIQRQARAVGLGAASIFWVDLGPPANYANAGAYRKAMGLNLKERSSGKYRGQLKISKRGSARARRWLYLAALRLIQEPRVKPWYAAKLRDNGGDKGKAIVAMMRRVAIAVWHVGAGEETFVLERCFPLPATASRRGGETVHR